MENIQLSKPTLVKMTGTARKMERIQTVKTTFLQLPRVQSDRECMGNTITTNLSIVTAVRFSMAAVADRTLWITIVSVVLNDGQEK